MMPLVGIANDKSWMGFTFVGAKLVKTRDARKKKNIKKKKKKKIKKKKKKKGSVEELCSKFFWCIIARYQKKDLRVGLSWLF